MLDQLHFTFDIAYKPLSELTSWSAFALELISYLGGVIAISHALVKYRSGMRKPVCLVVAVLLSSVVLEWWLLHKPRHIAHADFMFMLVDWQWPVYRCFLHLAIFYHVYFLIDRMKNSPLQRAFIAAFFISLVYLQLESLGPFLNWWRWTSQQFSAWIYNVPLDTCMLNLIYALSVCLGMNIWVEQNKKWVWQLLSAVLISILLIFSVSAANIALQVLFKQLNLDAYSSVLGSAYIALFLLTGMCCIHYVNIKAIYLSSVDRVLSFFPVVCLLFIAFVCIKYWNTMRIAREIPGLQENLGNFVGLVASWLLIVGIVLSSVMMRKRTASNELDTI